MQMNYPRSVIPKMRERKLTNGVNWQGALKQKRRITGVKKDPVVL